MRLLVVEDESRLALLLKRGLEERGYSVDVTGDGAEALWLATETDYDAIVLDVMLPSRRWAPVLLLTARDGIDDRVRGWTPAHRQAWRGRPELKLPPRSSRCWSCRVPAPQGRPALRGRTWRRCAGPATGCGARRSLDADPAAPDPGRGGVTIVLAGLLSPRVLRASLVAAIDEHLVKRSDAGCDWPSRSSWWHSAWRSASPGSPARTDAAAGQEGRDDVALTGDAAGNQVGWWSPGSAS